jgi:hypothetical protein
LRLRRKAEALTLKEEELLEMLRAILKEKGVSVEEVLDTSRRGQG